MAEKVTIEQKKEHAKLLFTREGVTVQKELAARCGVSEKTIGKWIKDGGWEKLRTTLTMTREEELRRLYEQLAELNDAIQGRPKGQRYGNSKEADTQVKLTSAIRTLEMKVSTSQSVEVLQALVNLVRSESLPDAKVVTKWADIYIKTLLR